MRCAARQTEDGPQGEAVANAKECSVSNRARQSPQRPGLKKRSPSKWLGNGSAPVPCCTNLYLLTIQRGYRYSRRPARWLTGNNPLGREVAMSLIGASEPTAPVGSRAIRRMAGLNGPAHTFVRLADNWLRAAVGGCKGVFPGRKHMKAAFTSGSVTVISI